MTGPILPCGREVGAAAATPTDRWFVSFAAVRIAVSRAPGAEREVSALELFFDLVYVFAIGQLSHHLFEHVLVAVAFTDTVQEGIQAPSRSA